MSARSLTSRWTAAFAAAAAFSLAAGAVPAAADDHTYTVHLRQPLPRTATTDDGGAPQQGAEQCPGIPAGQDGWHFVLPGGKAEFVKLTVVFEPGGSQVITDFGPPSGKHAYAASEPGAELTSAVAEVEGGNLELFNLSHTCSAQAAPTSTPTSTPTPTPTPSGEPSGEPSEKPSGEPSDGATDQPGGGGSEQPAPAPSPDGNGGGLAETGAEVAGISLGAALLLGAGGFLVLRRRRAPVRQEPTSRP